MREGAGYVYISGRYGDHDPWLVIERRIVRAREHAVALAHAGIPYFSPHLNSAHFEAVVPGVAREFWLRLDEVFRAGAAALLVVTHEWDKSVGTKADVAFAETTGCPVYWTETIDNLVRDWPTIIGEPGA